MIKSFLRLGRTFLTTKYQKYKVTRLPGEQFVAMLSDEATLSELFYHIKFNFQIENELIAGAGFTEDLSIVPVNDQMKEVNQEIKNTPFLPILLANDLYIYQIQKEQAHLIYGLEIIELNHTNNRNLPENIQNAITQLSFEWDNARTYSDIIKSPKIQDPTSPDIQQERQEIEESIFRASATVDMLNKLKMNDPLKELIKKMTLLMGTNWIFLFSITYGGYGWDVGEPISYLTSVGVDLLAMLRIFDLQEKINSEIMINQGRWMGLLNLYAHKNRQKWLHRYLRRQIN